VLQEGEPGHNPKVNQLITLTRAARYDVIAAIDSNVRIRPNYLREVAAVLEQPRVGLATHMIAGIGEKRLGAILDNLTLASFVAPGVAGVESIGIEQIVGKSIAVKKSVLQSLGGWQTGEGCPG